jgi:hypothetical protein
MARCGAAADYGLRVPSGLGLVGGFGRALAGRPSWKGPGWDSNPMDGTAFMQMSRYTLCALGGSTVIKGEDRTRDR